VVDAAAMNIDTRGKPNIMENGIVVDDLLSLNFSKKYVMVFS